MVCRGRKIGQVYLERGNSSGFRRISRQVWAGTAAVITVAAATSSALFVRKPPDLDTSDAHQGISIRQDIKVIPGAREVASAVGRGLIAIADTIGEASDRAREQRDITRRSMSQIQGSPEAIRKMKADISQTVKALKSNREKALALISRSSSGWNDARGDEFRGVLKKIGHSIAQATELLHVTVPGLEKLAQSLDEYARVNFRR